MAKWDMPNTDLDAANRARTLLSQEKARLEDNVAMLQARVEAYAEQVARMRRALHSISIAPAQTPGSWKNLAEVMRDHAREALK